MHRAEEFQYTKRIRLHKRSEKYSAHFMGFNIFSAEILQNVLRKRPDVSDENSQDHNPHEI